MKKKTKRIILISVISLITLGVAGIGFVAFVDYKRSKNENMEVTIKLSGAAEEAQAIVSDPNQQYMINVFIKNSAGAPLQGHYIYGVATDGSFDSMSVKTNRNGRAQFIYYPAYYVDEETTPLAPITFTFKDYSNSYLFLIPPTISVTKPEVAPEEPPEYPDWQHLYDSSNASNV